MSRYKDPKLYLLGVDPSVQSTTLPAGKLPTEQQILICLFAKLDKCEKNTNVYKISLDLVKDQISNIYQRARIPMKPERTVAKEIVQLHDQLYQLNKIPKARRDSHQPSIDKIENFKIQIKQTMKLWTVDALEKISNKEDKAFLESMKTDRKATMTGVDLKLTTTEAKVAKRKEAELKRQNSEEMRKKQCCSTTLEDDSGEDIDDNDDRTHKPFVIDERKHRRTVKTGQTLFVPHNILQAPLVVSTAARNKISPTSLSAITSAIIKSCNGNTEKFSLSYTSSYR